MQKKPISVTYCNPSGLVFRHCMNDSGEIKENGYLVDHSHARYEIYYLVTGNVTIYVSDAEYKVNHGDIIILNAFENHKVKVTSEENYERYVVEFSKDSIPNILESNPLNAFFKINHFVDVIPAHIVAASDVVNDFVKIEKIVKGEAQYQAHLILSQIIRIVSKLADTKSKLDFPLTQPELVKGNDSALIARTILYINEHIGDKILVEDIAKSIFISKSYLQHLFKERIGISLKQYIIKQKMQVAFSYLQTDMSFDEICSKLGYDYYTNFCSSFKRIYGYPPKKVRKS